LTLNVVADKIIKGRVYPALAEWQGRPFHPSWREFDRHWPYTVPLRLEEYSKAWGVDIRIYGVDQPVPPQSFYPVALGFFDFGIDYMSLLSHTVKQRVRDGDFRLLFYYHEGDNPLRIKQRLDQLCQNHDLPDRCYVFVSGNTKANSLENFVWFSDFEFWYWHRNRPISPLPAHTGPRDREFTVLARGHRSWRMAAMADLQRLGMLDRSHWSYGETGDFVDDECPIEVDAIPGLRLAIQDFQQQIPHQCDDLTLDQHNDHSLGADHLYSDSWFHIVMETHFDVDQSGGAFLTEKTFKPIKNGQPFVIVGGPGSLQALRDLGYRVFDSVIDNSYDLIQDSTQRWLAITETLAQIQFQGLASVYESCRSDIEHNQQLFQSLKQQRLNSFIEALNAK
jgi:hypothetical protein